MKTKDRIDEVIENLEYESIKDPIELERKVRSTHSDFVAKEILQRLNVKWSN